MKCRGDRAAAVLELIVISLDTSAFASLMFRKPRVVP
jgi:hypothetical protein